MIDMLNQRYGSLLVFARGPNYAVGKSKGTRWHCICDCGKKTLVSGYKLRTGNTQSCGNAGCLYNKHRKYSNKRESAIRNFYSTYYRAALDRSLVWEIDYILFEQLIKYNCFYCGYKYDYTITTGQNTRILLRACGLDRVDNTQGYTILNTVPCCKRCNIAKADMSVQEYINQAKRIAERH